MRILVTGANGFVGATLCRKLVEKKYKVRGLVRKTSDLSLLEGVEIERFVGALDDLSSLEKAAEDVELVYHAASAVTDWGTLKFFRKVIVEGTQNMLEASIRAGVKRFVYVSTAAVHSFVGAQDMTEKSPRLPTPFPYCQTKREAEAIVSDYHQFKGLETVIVRPGDIYGPGDRVSLLKMAKMLEAGRMAYVGGGKKLGAFTYVENLVDGLILAGEKKKAPGETYIITDGIKMTWCEYFEKLTTALDIPKPRFSVHPVIAYIAAVKLEFFYRLFHIQSRPLITRYLITHLRKDFHFSIEKAKRELGYEPRVHVDEAIGRTAEWYKKVVRRSE